jgi:hypothetical protein
MQDKLEERINALEKEVAILKSRVYRRNHPSPWEIAQHWLSTENTPFCNSRDLILYTICNDVRRIQTPHCFRCDEYMPWGSSILLPYAHVPFSTELNEEQKWNISGKWLERAHLVDRALGGPDSPDNMVMLCHGCHVVMPSFDFGKRQAAIDWILENSINVEAIMNRPLPRRLPPPRRRRLLEKFGGIVCAADVPDED